MTRTTLLARIGAAIAIAAVSTGASASGANAVTIYRCGVAGNAFTDLPCAGGHIFKVADDSRSDAQRAEAARVAAADQQLANDLMRERVKLAAAMPPAAAAFTAKALPAAPIDTADRRSSGRKRQVAAARQTALGDRVDFIAFAPRSTRAADR